MKSATGRKRDPWLGPNHPGDPMILIIAPELAGKGGDFAPVRVKTPFTRCTNCSRFLRYRAAAWCWKRQDRTDKVCTRCHGAAAIVHKGHPLYDMLERFMQGDADPPSAPD